MIADSFQDKINLKYITNIGEYFFKNQNNTYPTTVVTENYKSYRIEKIVSEDNINQYL